MVYTECGLYSVISRNGCFCENIMYGLKNMQHRGRESFGISFVDDGRINVIKKIGLVSPIIGLKYCESKSWMGHVRYSTSGAKRDDDPDAFIKVCQPITSNSPILGTYSIAHNGNIPITVFKAITKLYKQFRFQEPISSDTIILRDLIEHLAFLANKKHRVLANKALANKVWEDVLVTLMNIIPGACCLLVQTVDTLWIFKDRYGIKPLTIKRDPDELYVASESVAFRDTENITNVNPGEIIKVDYNTLTCKKVHEMKCNRGKRCVFEDLYFLRPNTVNDGLSIEAFRKNIGREITTQININNNSLLEKIKSEEPIVCGVPSSGITYGKGFAESMGLEYHQFIEKRDSYPWRTFILESNDKRIKACQKKYTLEPDIIKGQSIVIVDDSIVRGNTLKYLIKYIKLSCDVKSIHIVSGTPPIKHPCLYGVDFPDIEDLFANNVSVDKMHEHLDVQSVSYLDVSTLHKLTDNICDACFTGKYMF